MIELSAAVASCTGAHRETNQDSAAASPRVALVADGVGGNAGGDVASWTVTHLLAAHLPASGAPAGHDDLRRLLAQACWDLGLRTRAQPGLAGLSTTLTGVLVAPGQDRLVLVHVGDSRAYRLRDGVLTQVSRDDSLVQALVEAGQLDPREAADHPRRNVILASLGGTPDDAATVTIVDVDAEPGDRWLLASDGLSDYVAREEIERLVVGSPSPRAVADALVLAGLAADARDNVTVAVADVVPSRSGPPPRRSWTFAGAAADARLGVVMDLVAPT